MINRHLAVNFVMAKSICRYNIYLSEIYTYRIWLFYICFVCQTVTRFSSIFSTINKQYSIYVKLHV